MKKIININLSGRVIPIEDSAYEKLQAYVESLRRYFAHEEGRDEIINDIESRVAELMYEKIRKGATVVTDEDINQIIASMGRPEDFDQDAKETSYTSAGIGSKAAAEEAGGYTEPKKGRGRLYRDTNDKLLGGVCSGLSAYLNIDPAIMRIIFALVTFGGFGTGILIYIILWIVLPPKPLEHRVGKRLYRNPNDRMIAGVAGGLAAYFNKESWVVRLILAAPIVLNIFFGVFAGIFLGDELIFPNIFFGSLSFTFVFAYIILWAVLPVAKTNYQQMEMRGEKVDVNTIRQNVQEELSQIKEQVRGVGAEAKAAAASLGEKAKDMAGRTKTFAAEVAQTGRSAGGSIGRAIGVLFKIFFLFIAFGFAFALFVGIMTLIFGGIAWWPINGFLWSSSTQQFLAWATLIFFFLVPIIGFIVWLVRRVMRVKSRNNYLGWTFAGMWTLGWIFAILCTVSVAKDFKRYDKVVADLPISQPINDKLTIRVNEPQLMYSGSIWWIDSDAEGWDITEDTMKMANIKLHVEKSEDSLFHVTVWKWSAGKNITDAKTRAEKITYNISSVDSFLNLGSHFAISKNEKFRGQNVMVDIYVPVGKKIRFDESILEELDPLTVRRNTRYDWEGNSRRYNWNVKFDDDGYFPWKVNIDYLMMADGKLQDTTSASKPKSIEERERELQEKERKTEEERRQLENEKRRQRNDTTPGSNSRQEGLDEEDEVITKAEYHSPIQAIFKAFH